MIGGERFDTFDWLKLVATLCRRLGWTKNEVLDQVDMPFLEALQREWEDWPPIEVWVASYFGHKPKQRSSDFTELLAMFPGGQIR